MALLSKKAQLKKYGGMKGYRLEMSRRRKLRNVKDEPGELSKRKMIKEEIYNLKDLLTEREQKQDWHWRKGR